MKTIVHVNQTVIANNRAYNKNDPPLTILSNGSETHCHEVSLENARIIHNPIAPLPSGARVWIETENPVKILR